MQREKVVRATLAECGCSTKEIMAITGHRTMTEIERYTIEAEQARLAEAAIVKLSDYRRKSS